MREIKFRGKATVPHEDMGWVYGSLVVGPVFNSIHFTTNKGPQSVLVDWIGIGQYTGLKDKNGTEIYEGDVIEIHHGDGNQTTGVVFYWERSCAVFLMMESGEPRCLFQEWEAFRKCVYAYIQVIGNVFDNVKLKERFWTVWNKEVIRKQ